AGQATVHWYRIDTTNLDALALKDQGNVGGEDIAPGTYTFDPALTVNSAGTMGLGFSASGPNIFPGAYYTGRLSTDPPGTVRPSRPLAAGQDYYVRTLGSSNNRWGDFSSIAVDPSDDTTFWVYNEYAMTRGSPDSAGQDGRWGTRFGRFTITGDPGQAPPQPSDPGDDLSDNLIASPRSVASARPLRREGAGPEWLLALDSLHGFALGCDAGPVPAAAIQGNASQERPGPEAVPWRFSPAVGLGEMGRRPLDRVNLRGYASGTTPVPFPLQAIDQVFRDDTGAWIEDTGLEGVLPR